MVVVNAPCGDLGLAFAPDGSNVVTSISSSSPLIGTVHPNWRLLHVDGIDVEQLSPDGLTRLLEMRANEVHALEFEEVNEHAVHRAIRAAFSNRWADGTAGVVQAPPGRLGLTLGARDGLVTVFAISEGSPLKSEVQIGWQICEVDGADVIGLDPTEVTLRLTSCLAQMRRLRFRPVATTLGLGVTFTDRPPAVAAIEVGSPLSGRVALGAVLTALNGVAVSQETDWEALAAEAFAQSVLVLEFWSAPVPNLRMEHIDFVPRATGRAIDVIDNKATLWMRHSRISEFEPLAHLQERMSGFLRSSGLQSASVETVHADEATIRLLDQTRFRITRTDFNNKKAPIFSYTILRVWYNALDRANQLPSVRAALAEQRQITADDVEKACTAP